MGQDDDRCLVVGLDLGERLVRPGDDQLVRGGYALAGGELRAGVRDDGRPSEELRCGAERLRRVDRAVDEEARRRAVPLREHARTVELEQAVSASSQNRVRMCCELGWSVADRLAAFDDEELPAGVVALEHREEDGSRVLRQRGQAFEKVAHVTFSRKTSISPPQGRPTLHAWSSEMP